MRFIFLFLTFFLSLQLEAQEKLNAKPVKVACVGNSITFGAGLQNQLRDSYPAVLGQMLGKTYCVRNFGVSGSTLLCNGDLPYREQSAYREALAFQPDIVVIKLGTNDSKPQNWKFKSDFRKDLVALINVFRNLSSTPEIYLCYPSTVYKKTGINEDVISKEIIPLIKEISQELETKLIDLHTPTAHKGELFPDTVHPNAEGAIILAETVYTEITGKTLRHLPQAFPGFKSDWNGGDKYEFEYNGRQAVVVAPKVCGSGRPWIWRPAFFGAFASADKALLQHGFHIVYYDLTHDYGNHDAIELANGFYESMLHYYNLSPKVTLEGLSRGGFMALNWAIRNVDKIACIYVDAPVCNLFSWPGRQRPSMWQDVLSKWHLTDIQMEQFSGNPIDNLHSLAENKIPIILVCGDSDKTVPYEENGKILYERYRKLGAPIELILKEGCDHHPHSLEDPSVIVDFILKNQD